MKKIILLLSTILVSSVSAQNYFGTKFIGETGSNSPSNLTKSGNRILLSSFIGGNLTGTFPITWRGGQDGILTSISTTDGSIQWIKQFAGGSAESVIDTAVDSAGNIYVTGFFSGAGATNGLDADPGSGVYTLSVPSAATNRDVFLVKLNPAGDFLWAKQLSSPSGAANDDVYAISIDSNGDILLAGSYVFIDFDPGAGNQTMTAVGTADAYILKLTSNGDFVWVKTFQGTSTKRITDMELDSSGNIYVVGSYQGNIDLNPDAVATDTKTTAGGFDSYVAKYSPTGDYLWGSSFGSTGADYLNKILLKDNNIYIGGYISGSVDLDPSTGVNSFTSAGGQDAFMSKFTTAGSYVTSFVIPGTTTNGDTVQDILMDSSNNIYLSGTFQNITVGGNNYASTVALADAFYLKLDSNLNFSKMYLEQGDGNQNAPLIQQLNGTKFLVVGGSKLNADFDFTSSVSPEVAPTAQIYTYLTKFDFETTAALGTIDSGVNSSNFTIYPNPAESDINIKSAKKIKMASIYSLDGKRVMTIDNNSNIKNINVSFLPKGVYIVQTTDENGEKAQAKLIKK